jgi:eukaryotic-like serine/threonine-protein kinase
MAFAAGARFGPYEILSPLGSGGMGEVYRARDTRLDRAVALKVLSPSSDTPGRLERFQREARAISRLSHPHICTLHDVGDQDGMTFIVMECLDGETLAERLEEGPLPLDQALRYGIQIAEALAAAHRHGVVHRDLKPGNVMLTRDGVKLLDFGLAKLRQTDAAGRDAATESVHLTEEGTLLGTVAYMAPEQLEGEESDDRTDVFALGVVLYEMATGRRPFSGRSRASLIAAILSSEPPPLASVQPLAPPLLERVVRRCLAKDPEDRWQSARDLAFELTAILEGGSEAGLPKPVATRRRARAALWGAVGAAAVASATWVGVLALEDRPLPAPSFRQVTFRRGYLSAARFAPDGQTLVYGAAWEGRPHQLFSTRVGSSESRQLGPDRAKLASISSSGEMAVILIAGGNNRGTLARAPLAGGAARELQEDVLDADWTPDGSEMAAVRRLGRSKFLVEYPVGKTVHESPSWIGSVRVSPKGERIALAAASSSGRGEVVVVDRSGTKTVLSTGWARLRGIAWSPDGGEVWFTATRAGTRELPALWAVSLEGRERLVARTPVELFLNDIGGDGRVLLTARDARAGMLCLPPGAARETEMGWLDYSWVEALSSDGKTILFADGAGDEPAVYLRASDGSPAVRLGEGVPHGLSPDGAWVVATRPGSREWFLLPTRAGTPRALPPGPIVRLETADWLDGSHLVLAGDEAGLPGRIYVQDVVAGTIRPLTPGGHVLPRRAAATPDGKAVLAGARPGGEWSLFPVGDGSPRPVPSLLREDEPLEWSGDGKVLYVANRGAATPETAAEVYRVDVATGRRRIFKTLTPPDPAGVDWIERIVLTPDGGSYCYTYRQTLGTLYVAEGLK